MTRILGLSGSLRKASFNTALLHAAAEVAPEGVAIEPRTLHGVPLYDGDLESTDGIPGAVSELTTALANADGLLMVTPEYNNGVPGVFKNAIDWMSRGEGMKSFRGKPVAVLGASAGGFGTALAQVHWLPVLRTLGTAPWFGAKLMVSRARTLVDENGRLTDDETRARLAKFLAGFAAFVRG
jgi:chromate reductase, NAD(P)H dehydrogenase (quinone)